jgi:type I restriction enzyme M protein
VEPGVDHPGRRVGWPSIMERDGVELEAHYRHLIEELGKEAGMLGIIFRKARNKILMRFVI